MVDTLPPVRSAIIRPIAPEDESVAELLEAQWGSRLVVTRGRIVDAARLPGFIAEDDGRIVGLITLDFSPEACEVVTLDAFVRRQGIGARLLAAAEVEAARRGARRIWLITSNDNVGALAFYQACGYRIVAVHADAITEARKLKPQIPLIGLNGVPIRDEIELEKRLPAPAPSSSTSG